MYIRRNVRASIILWFCWKHLLIFVSLSAAVYWAYYVKHWTWIGIPFLPVGTIGTAVAFYIGFKNNSSYERLWEARKIWAAIATQCRALGIIALALPAENSDVARAMKDRKAALIKRQICWTNLLRLQLRKAVDRWDPGKVPASVGLMDKLQASIPEEDDPNTYLRKYLSEREQLELSGKSNPALELIRWQANDLAQMSQQQLISEEKESRLLETVTTCIDQQSSAERIKTFPFPRQYAFFSGVFAWIFMILLPFSLVGEAFKDASGAAWLVIPFNTLICWIFWTMEQVGDSSEDPFEGGLNDVPMTAICRHIEIELLEMLGDEQIPEHVKPVADVLM